MILLLFVVPAPVDGIVSNILVYDAALIMEPLLLLVFLLFVAPIAGRSFKSAKEVLPDR